MKRDVLFLILVLGLFLNSFSQSSIELSFTAVDNSQYVLLDSIYIENLTQGGDTTIYAPESSLVIDVLGINDMPIEGSSLTLSQNYPNPIQQHTSFKLYLPDKENITIHVQNLLGQKLALFERELSQGTHTFVFYPGREDVYLLTASASAGSKSIKMANVNKSGNNKCKIIHSGFSSDHIANKSQHSISNFVFSFGDDLLYIGYAKASTVYAGSDILEDAPLSDETYQFEINAGLPCAELPYFIHEGQLYSTVHIGPGCWMKENLNAGTKIDGQYEQADNEVIEKYCYNDDDINCDKYGGLYQWDELMQYTYTNDAQGICPDGWMLPTDVVMQTLANYLFGLDQAGGLMKETGTNNWLPPNNAATNISGFTGLPGGHRNTSAEFWNLQQTGNFWTSTENNSSDAWRWYVDFNFEEGFRVSYPKSYAYSVRCIKRDTWTCGEPIYISLIGDHSYNTVEIGEQCWMAENLRVATYIDNTPIPNVTDDEEWPYLTTGARASYNNDYSLAASYGYLYNWYAVTDPRGLCPEGWHVPGIDEWTILTDFIGGVAEPHGNELKSCRQLNSPLGVACNTSNHPRWNPDTTHYGTDDYGFAGVPGGYRGNFCIELGNMGFWWSSTANSSDLAKWRALSHSSGEVFGIDNPEHKALGLSVRCIKD